MIPPVTEERLIQVASMMPTDAAKLLQQQTHFVRRHVVTQVARSLDYWEAQGVVLDPVAYDIVIGTFVGTLVANVVTIETLKEKSALPEA